ncbi:FtsK/SpoIIIE domain-containing protein [Nonomuraea sp. NPDC059194]|uniref:FtsK/SpoIIIE domain-containing protein n=1 Tax=Nonomuraea sp. NPDC059194 TaxID=3346764 RepID=UPI0036AD95A7
MTHTPDVESRGTDAAAPMDDIPPAVMETLVVLDQTAAIDVSAQEPREIEIEGHVVPGYELKYGPILPPWATTKQGWQDQIKLHIRKTAYIAAVHTVRSPKYTGRLALRTLIGAAVGVRGGWRFVSAYDHKVVVDQALNEGRKKDAANERATRRSEIWRRTKWTTALGLPGLGLLNALAVHYPLLPWGVGALAAAAAAAAGSTVSEVAVIDTPQLPVRLELAPEHLNDAFRAAGLIKQGQALTLVQGVAKDGKGWACILDLPRGCGKTANDVLRLREVLAAELGVDEIQLIMSRIRAHAGGHGGRIAIWVADDDPYMGKPISSPLVGAETWSVWEPIPFGRDARGNLIVLSIMWQSMFFGGLPRRGKTFSQRLLTAAGVLDAWVRHYVADGKGGSDWMAMRAIAHRLVLGAEDDAIAALVAMLNELIVEMERRFRIFRDLPASVCPESKLTPAIMRKYRMPVIFVTIDELQEYFTAMDKDLKDEVINKLCRIARRGPAAGFICNFASQRPDADSVPTKLREIVSYRYCTQVVDKTSSDMVLGKGKANQGADASILQEEHKGVGVLVTGPGSYVMPKCDYLDNAAFAEVCSRGRALREKEGTLSGDAVGDVVSAAESAGKQIPPVISDVLYVMHNSPRMFTTDILTGLVNVDEDTYGDWDAVRLAEELELAGVRRSTKQVKIDGQNLAGYNRRDIEDAVPAELFETPVGAAR